MSRQRCDLDIGEVARPKLAYLLYVLLINGFTSPQTVGFEISSFVQLLQQPSFGAGTQEGCAKKGSSPPGKGLAVSS